MKHPGPWSFMGNRVVDADGNDASSSRGPGTTRGIGFRCSVGLQRLAGKRKSSRSYLWDKGEAVIYVIDNGGEYSSHSVYFVEAPDDLGAYLGVEFFPWARANKVYH
jgi:hypothetical protein